VSIGAAGGGVDWQDRHNHGGLALVSPTFGEAGNHGCCIRGPYNGSSEPFISRSCAELAGLGYTRLSARIQVELVAYLSRLLAGEGLDAAALSPATVGAFLVARCAAGYTALRTPTALRPLLDHLRRIGVTPPVESVEPSPVEMLLGRYRGFLIGERGLTSGTTRGYVDLVRPFLVAIWTAHRPPSTVPALPLIQQHHPWPRHVSTGRLDRLV